MIEPEQDITDAEIVKEWPAGEDEPDTPIQPKAATPAIPAPSAIVPFKSEEEEEPAPAEIILDQTGADEEARKKRQADLHSKPGFTASAPSDAGTDQAREETPSLNEAKASGISDEDENRKCLEAIAELYGIEKLSDTDKLSSLRLASEKAPLIGTPSLLVNTTGNQAILAKGKIEFQNESVVDAADAFEGAILAKNDSASYSNGVYLNGDPRDRYMLMLAAQNVGLKVANPVTVDEETKQKVDDEWCAFVATKLTPTQPSTPKADEMAAAAKEMTEPTLNKDAQVRIPPTDSLGRREPTWGNPFPAMG